MWQQSFSQEIDLLQTSSQSKYGGNSLHFIQNLKCLTIQVLIELLLLVQAPKHQYSVCQAIHSILVEDARVIFQLHLQTYDLRAVPLMAESVESLHILLHQFAREQMGHLVNTYVNLKRDREMMLDQLKQSVKVVG